MKNYEFESIKNEFLDIYAAIRDLTEDEILNGPENIFRSHFERLQHLIAREVDDHLADELLCDRQLRPITQRISRLKTLNGLRMEIKYARSIIADSDPWIAVQGFIYYPNYLRLADMEYRGAELKPGDRVVFLGSGPLPLSLICLCNQYGVQGIGIEQVPEYAKISQKVIEVLELTEHIQIVRGTHFSLPLNEKCSLVMVAADAGPKHEIFTHLAKTLPKGTRLSYRIYEKGLRRLMDDGAALDIPPVFKEYLRIRPEPPVNNTSVFLIKTNFNRKTVNREYKDQMPEELLNITESVPTPFLIVEEEIVRKNINRIHDYANRHGFSVRPHIKTHKSLKIARMQLDSGAVGLAVAKVQEAEVMARLGPVDITVAYPAVGKNRTERIAKVSLKQKIRVAVDSEYLLNELGRSALKHGTCIGILVIFDPGLGRCGTADPVQIVTLAQHAKTHPGLGFDGIQMYLGHLYGDPARDSHSFEQINRLWEPVYEALCTAGLEPETVSSGSTPSIENTHLVRHITEIRVGTAVLNDYFVLKFGHCTRRDCAARVIATVISDVVPGRAIIDAGSKALSAKQLLRHENLEMGFIVEYPDARITRLHEEHGWVDVSRCTPAPKIGQRLSIIPVNVSLCINLYDHFYMITPAGILRKEQVDARGCLV